MPPLLTAPTPFWNLLESQTSPPQKWFCEVVGVLYKLGSCTFLLLLPLLDPFSSSCSDKLLTKGWLSALLFVPFSLCLPVWIASSRFWSPSSVVWSFSLFCCPAFLALLYSLFGTIPLMTVAITFDLWCYSGSVRRFASQSCSDFSNDDRQIVFVFQDKSWPKLTLKISL